MARETSSIFHISFVITPSLPSPNCTVLPVCAILSLSDYQRPDAPPPDEEPPPKPLREEDLEEERRGIV